MTALLTDNLPLLVGAPNGIKKLRELILELAVRGKLVPQDPNDEPAGELLKRIAEEKARLVVAGKKVSQQAEISDKEQPFFVPQSWSWVRLGSCLQMINGRAFKPTEWMAAGLPIVRIQNLNKPDAPFNYCDPDTVDDRHVIDTGTVLISWSGTPGTSFGAFIWERGKAALNQHIFSCFQVGDAFFDKFLKLAINTRLEELIAKAHGGVGLQHVTKGKLEALTLVLPPLAEQRRIVAKVDELMALCDRLEAQQADAETAHTQLVQALLDSLTQAADAEDFAASWQRLAEHFHTLFTTESTIDALKQTLLQLAVMGKLVPQDSSDEPASGYLDRIASSKDSLLSARKVKYRATAESAIIRALKYDVPESWIWMHFKDAVFFQEGPGIRNWQFRSEGVKLLNVSNIRFDDHLDLNSSDKYVSHDEFNEKYKHFLIQEGDLLFAGSGASWGKVAWYKDPGYPVILNTSTMRLRFFCDEFSANYLFYFVKSNFFKSQLIPQLAGLQPNFGSTHFSRIYIPIPPVAEQHRIVVKVDQLMALCDQLKTRLTHARQLNEQLATALVEQAVA